MTDDWLEYSAERGYRHIDFRPLLKLIQPMPRAHQELVNDIAKAICMRFEGVDDLEKLEYDRQKRYEDTAEAVVDMLYKRMLMPRLPRN